MTIALTIWAGYRFSVGSILHPGQMSPLEMEHLRRLPAGLARALFFPGVPAPEFFKGLAHVFGFRRNRKRATC